MIRRGVTATPTRCDLSDLLKRVPATMPFALEAFRHGHLRTITIPAEQPSEEAVSI